MELRHLKYFVMAAEEKNISRAAERLFVSQPAVSRQIKDLEDELGLPLFVRKPNGLSLTEAGATALAHAREIMRQANGMTEAMQALAKRRDCMTIKVGFLPTALPGFLTKAMRELHRKHTNLKVQIYDMPPPQQEQALRNGEIDLGLIGDPDASVRRDFHVETIRRVDVAMIVPDDHPLAKRKSVELAEFADDIFVTLHEKQFPGRPAMMAEMFCKAGINPEVSLRARGLTELLALVGSGAGVAIAPADLAQLPHSGLVFLKLKKPRRTLMFSAAWCKNIENPGVLELVELMKSN